MTRPLVRRLRGPCAAVLLAACTAAAAASFDCTRATGRVERLVCADAGLSALDDELADAHAMQPQSGEAAARLRATQRAWLRTRDACADGGAPGWQHAMALTCEAEAVEERLARAGARNPR